MCLAHPQVPVSVMQLLRLDFCGLTSAHLGFLTKYQQMVDLNSQLSILRSSSAHGGFIIVSRLLTFLNPMVVPKLLSRPPKDC